MAAHVKTGLEQMIADFTKPGPSRERTENLQSIYRSAFELSCWTEDLDLSHWSKLYNHVKSGDLNQAAADAQAMLYLYTDAWLALGSPSCREDWYKAKYSEV